MLSIGKLIIICSTVIAVVAMVTGHDGQLLHDVVTLFAGMGIGIGIEIFEKRAREKKGVVEFEGW